MWDTACLGSVVSALRAGFDVAGLSFRFFFDNSCGNLRASAHHYVGYDLPALMHAHALRAMLAHHQLQSQG
jgi:hypothetical protein